MYTFFRFDYGGQLRRLILQRIHDSSKCEQGKIYERTTWQTDCDNLRQFHPLFKAILEFPQHYPPGSEDQRVTPHHLTGAIHKHKTIELVFEVCAWQSCLLCKDSWIDSLTRWSFVGVLIGGKKYLNENLELHVSVIVWYLYFVTSMELRITSHFL